MVWQRKSTLSSNYLEYRKLFLKDCSDIHKAANSLEGATLQEAASAHYGHHYTLLFCPKGKAPASFTGCCAPGLVPVPASRKGVHGHPSPPLAAPRPRHICQAFSPLQLSWKNLQVPSRQITQLCPRSENWYLRPKCSSKTRQLYLAEARPQPLQSVKRLC